MYFRSAVNSNEQIRQISLIHQFAKYFCQMFPQIYLIFYIMV